ncbi:hypothetical protein CPB84DRAFT_1751475 [Gymnopilus junonius]|uniref:Uncharacterized protein n=1 Tax=Gymnopilus junonius TaxID=109634 RepID=A0A9P5NCZ0_GYMJU|nr:hypothetical protein CPB84DRAFT_1751475 [Gymnopilus junonius]
MASGLPPSSIQEGALSVTSNVLLTETLLLGVYTVVYLETVYIYLTKKESQQGFIIGTITLLYIVFVVEIGTQWESNKRAFINNGNSQTSVFIAVIAIPSWATPVTDICGLRFGTRTIGRNATQSEEDGSDTGIGDSHSFQESESSNEKQER